MSPYFVSCFCFLSIILDFVSQQPQHKSRRRNSVLPPWFTRRPCSVWGVHYYSNKFWRDAEGKSVNVNLQKERMWKWDFVRIFFFSYGVTNVMFLPPLSPKCLFKESRWMTNAWSAVDHHSDVCLKQKSFETDVNVSQMTTLLLFHCSLCVWSKVMILIPFVLFLFVFFSILWINTGRRR